MDGTFDIFKKTPDGTQWVEAVKGMQQAKKHLLHFRSLQTGTDEYLVFDSEQGHFIDIFDDAQSA